MDLLTKADLDTLAEREGPGPHVSLFSPTHRFGEGVRGDPIRWKNLLTEVEAVLTSGGMGVAATRELLAPALSLPDDGLAWQYMSDGLAMFIRPGWHRMFRIPVPVPAVGVVGDRFVVGPLLRLMSSDAHFLVLALSQRRVRLLEGSLQHVEEVELAEVPTALREIVQPPDPRSHTMARPAALAGRGGPAVFYGHGAADEHFKKEEVRRFLHGVATGLADLLKHQNLPMVLVGLDHLISAYRDVNTYPHLAEADVRQNPDQLSEDALRAAAWPVVERILTEERAAAFARFEELHGTGRASNDADTVEQAAREGRVDTLFLSAEPWCWEQVTNDFAALRLGTDPAFSRCELLDRATSDTLSQGGRVYAVSQAEVAGGGDVAAIFRY